MNDDPRSWTSAGYAIEMEGQEGVLSLGNVRIRLVQRQGKERGVLGLVIAYHDSQSDCSHLDLLVDGLPFKILHSRDNCTHTICTTFSKSKFIKKPNPNGACEVDHLVMLSSNMDATCAAFLKSLGVRPRRRMRPQSGWRASKEFAFFKLGDLLIEVIAPAEKQGEADQILASKDSSFWGLALTTWNMARSKLFFGGNASDIRQAFQAGRQIMTLKRIGVSVPTVFLSSRAVTEPAKL